MQNNKKKSRIPVQKTKFWAHKNGIHRIHFRNVGMCLTGTIYLNRMNSCYVLPIKSKECQAFEIYGFFFIFSFLYLFCSVLSFHITCSDGNAIFQKDLYFSIIQAICWENINENIAEFKRLIHKYIWSMEMKHFFLFSMERILMKYF